MKYKILLNEKQRNYLLQILDKDYENLKFDEKEIRYSIMNELWKQRKAKEEEYSPVKFL